MTTTDEKPVQYKRTAAFLTAVSLIEIVVIFYGWTLTI